MIPYYCVIIFKYAAIDIKCYKYMCKYINIHIFCPNYPPYKMHLTSYFCLLKQKVWNVIDLCIVSDYHECRSNVLCTILFSKIHGLSGLSMIVRSHTGSYLKLAEGFAHRLSYSIRIVPLCCTFCCTVYDQHICLMNTRAEYYAAFIFALYIAKLIIWLNAWCHEIKTFFTLPFNNNGTVSTLRCNAQ